jgi:hypothetical protein
MTGVIAAERPNVGRDAGRWPKITFHCILSYFFTRGSVMRRPTSLVTKSQISVISAGYIVSAFSLLFGLSISLHVFAAQADYVNFSKPDLLTFEESFSAT